MKPMHQKCCLLASVYSLFVLLVSSLVWDRRACAGVASHLLPYTVPTWPICKTLDTSTADCSSATQKCSNSSAGLTKIIDSCIAYRPCMLPSKSNLQVRHVRIYSEKQRLIAYGNLSWSETGASLLLYLPGSWAPR